jgi:hypothetical protein
MAKTYYKYVERGTESQINWGEVGRSVSEMIATEAAVREQKKAAIDESSRQFGEVLANAPTGAFTTANEWTLEYANDAAQALLLLDRQLKTGQISLKDYTIKRQNLNDSTNEMFNLSKMYQDKYAEALQRSQADASSKAEMEFINQVEGLSNFKDSKAYINPADYTVSVGKMIQTKGANGETVMMLDPNPNNYKRVNQLKNYMELKIDKYNYTEAIDSKVASLGKNETTVVKKLNGIYRTYGITNISDPTQRAKFGIQLTDEELKSMSAYELWEKNTIAAQFANPYVLQSVLMDAVAVDPKTGEQYEMTTNAEEAKSSSKYIYFEDDGSGRPVPKPTKEQEKVAEGFMRTMIRNSIDQTSKTDTQAMPSIDYAPEYILNRGDEKKETLNNAGYWNQLWWGDARQKTAAAEALLGTTIAQQQGLLAIDSSTPGFIKLKYDDGKKNRTVRLSDFTPAEWAATGVELHGENDRNRAMNAGGGFGGKTVNLSAGTEARRAGTANAPSGGKQSVQTKAKNYLDQKLGNGVLVSKGDAGVDEIVSIIQPLGFTGELTGTLHDYITITSPDGKTQKEFRLQNESGKNKAVAADIISWMQGQMNNEKLASADASGIFNSSAGGGSGDVLFKK